MEHKTSKLKGAKSLKGIPWNDLVYYDESSPTCLRHKRNIYYGNGDSILKVSAGDVAGNKTKEGYYSITLSKYGSFTIHRIVWFLNKNLDVPDDMLIDHIDGNRDNNKISNLRLVGKYGNARNCKKFKNNTSGFVGVYFDAKVFPNRKREKYYWKASWMELDGKQKTKAFSIDKFGILPAMALAIQHRADQIKRLNAEGAGYTDRHGL